MQAEPQRQLERVLSKEVLVPFVSCFVMLKQARERFQTLWFCPYGPKLFPNRKEAGENVRLLFIKRWFLPKEKVVCFIFDLVLLSFCTRLAESLSDAQSVANWFLQDGKVTFVNLFVQSYCAYIHKRSLNKNFKWFQTSSERMDCYNCILKYQRLKCRDDADKGGAFTSSQKTQMNKISCRHHLGACINTCNLSLKCTAAKLWDYTSTSLFT